MVQSVGDETTSAEHCLLNRAASFACLSDPVKRQMLGKIYFLSKYLFTDLLREDDQQVAEDLNQILEKHASVPMIG